MANLTIVRGDLTAKPIAAKQLADFFELNKNEFDGVLYIGYPIIGTNRGSYQIDCLLITREHGLITINLQEGSNEDIIDSFERIQDENFEKLNSKLFLDGNLTANRKLGFNINTATFAFRATEEISNEDYRAYPT